MNRAYQTPLPTGTAHRSDVTGIASKALRQLEARYPGVILLYRIGDAYVPLNDDGAVLALCGTDDIPIAGTDEPIRILLAAGRKVALVERVT